MTTAVSLPLQQHTHFAEALERLGREVCFIDMPGAPPVLTVRQFGQRIASRGPVWQDGCNAHALRASGLRMINAEMPQDAGLRAAGFRRTATDAHVAELDLTLSRQYRLRAMKPKWRHALRTATAHKLRLAEESYDKVRHDWLLRADLAQQRAKRFRGLPHALVGAYAAANPKAVRVLTAYEGGQPIAAMLFLLHAPVATYHIAWTSARGRAVSAHHRMLAHAADQFASRGFCRLDLGLVATDTATGLARFKIGTGARVRPLGGTWLRIFG